MSELIFLPVLALAVWRAAAIITDEEFAFGLASKFRESLGVVSRPVAMTYQKYDAVLKQNTTETMVVNRELPSSQQPTLLARGLRCMWCASYWASLPAAVVAAFMYGYGFIETVVLWHALSAAVIGLNKLID